MAKTAILNGRVVLPDRVLEESGVLIEDGILTAVGTVTPDPDAAVVDAGGNLILPGFIEAHLHGGGGSDFMDGTKEDFETIARTHCLHGTTAMTATTLSAPYEEMKALFNLYRQAAAQSKTAQFLGVHLEGPYLSQELRGAQNPAYIRNPTKEEVDRLMRDAGDIILRCSCAPELEGADYLAAAMQEAGVVLSVGHSAATCAQILKAYDQGFRHITHMYCATPSIRKINQRVYGGVVEAAYLLDDMVIELIGDGRHIPPEVLRLALKLKGEDGVFLITDAMRAAGTDVEESYLGTSRPENRVIIEDGVAKLPDRSSYAGSIATSDAVFRNACDCGFPLPVVSKLMSLNPAIHLGVQARKGSLDVGKDADVVVLDANRQVSQVYVRGRAVK